VIEQQGKFDWMLKDLYDGVPGIEMIVVLSADGLRIARYSGDPDAADRVAAACAGRVRSPRRSRPATAT
jgi:predicted regulator of Ras-like GTPase activity (Roadblock/LC7/MglB family)